MYISFLVLFLYVYGRVYADESKPVINVVVGQPLLQMPGMAQVPRGDRSDYIVKYKFNTSQRETFQPFIDELHEFIDEHEGVTPVRDDCTDVQRTRARRADVRSSVCRVDRSVLGLCDGRQDPSFGFATGQPCVLLKLNKVWGWKPQMLTSSQTHLPVKCEPAHTLYWHTADGTYDTATIYPSTGLPVHCFPYCGPGEAHTQPFVMAKFTGVSRGREALVVCRLHAAGNIGNSSSTLQQRDRIASTNFAFLIH